MKICLATILLAAILYGQQSGVGPGQAAALPPGAQNQPPPANPTRAEDLCFLEGQLTNVATGAAVKKAELTLDRVDLNRTTATVPTTYTTTSDAGGRYAMKDLEPGKYRLVVTANGYARASYGARGPNSSGTTISLEAGQHLKDVNLKLTPHGVVAGRVVDQDGDPLPNINVQAQSYRRIDGRKQLVPSGSASTNDLGEYRIFGLAPNKYYFSASDNHMVNFGQVVKDVSAKPAPEEGFVSTYYPGATDIAAAAAHRLTGRRRNARHEHCLVERTHRPCPGPCQWHSRGRKAQHQCHAHAQRRRGVNIFWPALPFFRRCAGRFSN